MSRDKVGVIAMARKRHEITRPSDCVNDSVVLEFTALRQYGRLRESDREQALISRLRLFLLEQRNGLTEFVQVALAQLTPRAIPQRKPHPAQRSSRSALATGVLLELSFEFSRARQAPA